MRSGAFEWSLAGWRMMRGAKHRHRRRVAELNPWGAQDTDRAARRDWKRLEREHADLRDMFADDGEFLDAVEERWGLV